MSRIVNGFGYVFLGFSLFTSSFAAAANVATISPVIGIDSLT